MAKNDNNQLEKKQTVKEFLNSTSYYFTTVHTKKCTICKLPEEHKKIVNRMILENKSTTVIGSYLIQRFPHIFPNFDDLSKKINKHAEYLPLLIDDVTIKSIFTRARYILEEKEFATLTEVEKAEVINEIEVELMKEYSDVEKDRLSMVQVMFKEVLPLLITRLTYEIEHGAGRDIKDITDASKTLLQMASVLTMTSTQSAPVGVTAEVINDYDDANTENKVLSLTERLKESTERK